MTPDGYAIGVDLGTSNTVAVVRWPDGRTRPLLHDGAPILPSGVFADEAGRLHVGRDAQRLAQLDPARFEPNPKRRIDEAGVLLGEREVPVVDLLGALLGAVARAAVEAVGFLPPAVMTYPAAWGQRRRDVLTAAATRAGWPPVRLVPEPVAAARYFTGTLRRPVPVGSSLAVFDFGGGTLDIAVVRNDGNGFAVLGSGGIEDLGGLDIDAALVEHLGGVTAADWRQRRLFWDDVRGAKEMLSRTTVAPVAVPGAERAVHLTREELERVASPLLRRAVYETGAVIGRCGLRPDQLAGLFLVGGSSRLPLAARLLHAELGVAPTTLEQPEVPVAEGALAELPVQAPAPAPTGRVYGSAPVSPAPQVSSAAPASPAAPPVSPAPPVSAAPPISPAPSGSAAPPVSPAPAPPAGRPWYLRRPALLAGAAGLVAALVVTAVFVVFTWRGPSPVAFSQLEPLGGPAIDGDGYVSEAFTAVVGDRGYVSYVREKQLHVAAVDMGTAKTVWPQRPIGTGDSWSGMFATPEVVVAFTNRYGSAEKPRTAYAVAADNGKALWKLDLANDDRLLFYDTVAVLVSEHDHLMRGYDIRTLKERWKRDFPRSESGSQQVKIVDVSTDADVTGPAGLDGWPTAPDRGDDRRLLVIGEDKKLQVYDVSSGNPAKQASGVGEPRFTYLAHDGRLYVADDETPYRITSYDLDTLDKPQIVYTSPDKNRQVKKLAPCGKGHLCLLDTASYDVKTTDVVSVDTASGKQDWRHRSAGADTLAPVGDGVLATDTSSSTASSTLFARDGSAVLKAADARGAAVRVNAESLLVFSDQPSAALADTGVVGVQVDGGDRIPLGTLTKSKARSCTWNESAMLCAADRKFTVWRFGTV